MFSFLKDLDYRLFERYRTLERNIKSASNSFYDSYLDLQEQFLRIVLENEGVETSSGNSSGSLLKNPTCQNLLLSVIGIDQRTYDKMGDYALKVNAHKHKKEKRITLDTILNYLGVIYDAMFAYAKFKGIECSPLEISAYAEMFGVFERENATLRTECDKLREELSTSVEEGKLKDSDIETFKNLARGAELDKLSLEEQNAELQKQISILKDIKLASMEDKLNKTIEMYLEGKSFQQISNIFNEDVLDFYYKIKFCDYFTIKKMLDNNGLSDYKYILDECDKYELVINSNNIYNTFAKKESIHSPVYIDAFDRNSNIQRDLEIYERYYVKSNENIQEFYRNPIFNTYLENWVFVSPFIDFTKMENLVYFKKRKRCI